MLGSMLLFGAAGCAPIEDLPVHAWSGPEAALQVMAERADRLERFTAKGQVTMGGEAGPVTLDTVLVARPPQHLRWRAWKFGRAVADLTVTPEGVWLWNDPRAQSLAEALGREQADPRRLMSWAGWDGALFRDPELRVRDSGGPRFTLVRSPSASSPGELRIEVDRATLTPRLYSIRAGEREAARVTLSQYQHGEGMVWPMRIDIASGGQNLSVRLNSFEPNAALNPAAFKPSRRAKPLH